MISVQQLTKAYGPVLAVDRVSFDVPKGQVVGFLGPNGAGKTSTIKVLCTLLRPHGGKVTVCGCDVVKDAATVRATSCSWRPYHS